MHLQTCLITASKWISKLAQSWPPSASVSSLDLSLQVHLPTGSITASKSNVKERRWVYGATGLMAVECARWSIYSGDPGVDRHHLIFISSCHPAKIHTLSFPTFSLTHSCRDFVDPFNCVDSHSQVVSYLLTGFLRCSS